MAMHLTIPDQRLLRKTGEVDYFEWNYKFPIKYIQRYRFNKIIKLMGKSKYHTILEAGTGSGIFLPELSKHCDEIYAIDVHSHFDQVQELCRNCNVKNSTVVQQSIEKTSFPDETFDAIVAISVLEFVTDIQKAVDEIKRLLKKDGTFFTICPMESKFLDFFLSFYTGKKPAEEFGNSRQKVTNILEQNFTIEKKGYMIPLVGRFFPVYTHYKLKKP